MLQPDNPLSRDVVDPSDDSGFSSISLPSIRDAPIVTSEVVNNEGTIGEGIEFANPDLIAEDLRARASKQKRLDSEVLAERRAEKLREKEAYEKEIQEKQYKCLMTLLSKSKALASFILKKVNNEVEVKTQTCKRKAEPKSSPVPKKKQQKLSSTASKKTETKKGRGRKKLNLSEEDIEETLASMSDGESEQKENEVIIDSYVKSQYFEGELRDYQKVGVNWMKVLYENGLNGILADEMGLGKTIQVIALFADLIQKNLEGPYLVIVPLSTLPNWKAEFERFAPQLPVIIYYGNAQDRNDIKRLSMKKYRIGTFLTYPIVITTYQMPLFDTKFFLPFNWRYIIVDEAQRIKNYECQLFRAIKSLKSLNRLILTGTPLQNNLAELWSLLNFLLPDIFKDLNVFQNWFDAKSVQNDEGKKKFFKQEQEKQVLKTLSEILQPFMLRRLKEDVCPDIPPIKEVIVYAPLTAIQYDLYSSILKRDIGRLTKREVKSVIVDEDGRRPKRKCTQKVSTNLYNWKENLGINDFSSKADDKTVMIGNTKIKEEDMDMWNKFTSVTQENVDYLIHLKLSNEVMMYRHVVNHPYIIHYPTNNFGLCRIDDDIIKVSGKILVLDAMLKKLKKDGHKVLLFSTMKIVLDVIEDYLSLTNYQYVRLDGSVKYEERSSNIDQFQNNEEIFLFLLSTKAGAVGINLTAADTIIIYDSDWNPQNDLQAMARCHRIGQTKPVVAYRLCTKGTIDEEMIKRANAKRFLEKAVISKENCFTNSEEGLQRLNKLLQEETMKVIDPKKAVYTDAELDELLDRSDMVIKSGNNVP